MSNRETRPVKTRLAKGTSRQAADTFYDHALDILTEDLEKLSETFTIVIAPANAEDEAWARARWPSFEVLPQIDRPNLGDRIQTTINTLLEDHDKVLLIGSDAPSLPTDHILACLECLEVDTVLGPADDGGFYLIGSRRPLPNLQEVRWSSHYALEDTREVLLRADLTNEVGPYWYDIDTVEDLWRLERDLPPDSPAKIRMLQFLSTLPKVTVVVPTLNEEENILPLTYSLRNLEPTPEILFIDGGSRDQTPLKITQAGLFPLQTKTNRGAQLNAGIEQAHGQLLLFLHADTTIDQQSYSAMLAAAEDPDCWGGAFRYALPDDDWRCRVIEKGVYLRNALFKLPYGDQAYFIKRGAIEQVGPFLEIRLMEDVEWFTRLKKTGHYRLLDAVALTSSRRIFAKGWIRSGAINLTLVTLYKLGADPDELARFYYGKSQSKQADELVAR